MKAFKFLVFLIVLGLLAVVGYQNQDYFLTDTALHIDLKIASLHYTAQSLPNWAYWGICFGLGLVITGLKGLFTAFRLGREIKQKEAEISDLNKKANKLKAELEIFTRDPYIKKAIAAKAEKETETQETDAPKGNADNPPVSE